MRKAAAVWVVLAGLCLAAAAHAEDEFGGAVQLYEEKKFAEAAKEFEAVLKSGSSAALYYNLGNCYFKLGKKAKAVWAYEKAAALDPRDADIEWNLGLLRKQLQDKQERLPRFFAAEWLAGLVRGVKSDVLAAVLTAAVAAFAALLLFHAAIPPLRPFLKRLIPLAGILAAVAGLFVAVRWDDARISSGVVADPEVYARYGPSADATRAFLLHEGTKVALLRRSGGWFFVQFGVAQKGWVPEEAVLTL